MCQATATMAPWLHSSLAWSTTFCRFATAEPANRKSPPHSPGYWPVMSCTFAVYCDGWVAGSLLCWPAIVYRPEICCRYATAPALGSACARAGTSDAATSTATSPAFRLFLEHSLHTEDTKRLSTREPSQ